MSQQFLVLVLRRYIFKYFRSEVSKSPKLLAPVSMSYSMTQNWALLPIWVYFEADPKLLPKKNHDPVPRFSSSVCSWEAFYSHRCLITLFNCSARMSHLSWSPLIIRQAHDSQYSLPLCMCRMVSCEI